MSTRRDDVLARQAASLAFALMEQQPLPGQILSLLSNPGAAASGKQLASVLRRRLTNVLRECRRMERDGKLRRVKGKWHRVREDQ